MIDHTAVNVTDLAAAKDFYTKALAPLGYSLVFEVEGFLGFGDAGAPNFGVVQRVDAFHAAALEAGGTDNGAPGLRSHYHEHYYAAFVRDADGNNIEAVCQTPA
jgi:catechol 2,3-dioxygenase-like lactoylglutathione lyase family enzyme